tara:strand:- start:277 stop:2739 length:2463 start_codon:yes stop_codon:yes gene_type:complete
LRPDQDKPSKCLLELWCESKEMTAHEQYRKLYKIQMHLRELFKKNPANLVQTMNTLRAQIRNHVDTPTTSDTSNPTTSTPANTQTSIKTICDNLKTVTKPSPDFNAFVEKLLKALKDADPEPDKSVIELPKTLLQSILQTDAIPIKREGVGWKTDALHIDSVEEMQDAILKFARDPTYATNIMITNHLENDPDIPDYFATVSRYRVKNTNHGRGLFSSTTIKEKSQVCTYRGKWYASAIEFDQKFKSEPEETKKLHEAYSVKNTAPGNFTWETTNHAFCANYSGAQFELIDATKYYDAAAAYANEASSSTENTCQLTMTKTGYCVIEVQQGKLISAGNEIMCDYNQEKTPLRKGRNYDEEFINTCLTNAKTEREKFDFKGMEMAVYEMPGFFLSSEESNDQVLFEVVTQGHNYEKISTKKSAKETVCIMKPAPLTDVETLKTYYARMIQSIEKVVIRNLRVYPKNWYVELKDMVDVLANNATCNPNQILQKAIRYVDNYRIHSFPVFEAAVFACVKIDAIDQLQEDESNYDDTTTYNWVLRDYLQGALNKCDPGRIKALLTKKLTVAKTTYEIDISYIFDRLWSLHEQYYAEYEDKDAIYKKIEVVCQVIIDVWGEDEFFEANLEQWSQHEILSDHIPQVVELEYDTKFKEYAAQELAVWKQTNPDTNPNTNKEWEAKKEQLSDTFQREFKGFQEHITAQGKYSQCIDKLSKDLNRNKWGLKINMIYALQVCETEIVTVEGWKNTPAENIKEHIEALQTNPFTNKILEERRKDAMNIYKAYLKETSLDQSNANDDADDADADADATNVTLNFAVPFGDED